MAAKHCASSEGREKAGPQTCSSRTDIKYYALIYASHGKEMRIGIELSSRDETWQKVRRRKSVKHSADVFMRSSIIVTG
jgi:hypothetical protein